jgi:hypothetical protein
VSANEYDNDGSGSSGGDSSGASLDLGDGTGTDVLNGIVNFLQAGGDVTRLLTAFVVGVPASIFVAIGDIVAAVANFFATPFMEGGDAIGQLINAFFTAPASLLERGAQISEDTLALFLSDSLAGLLALPVATSVVVLSLYLIVRYLQEDETGDTLPGLPIDIPTETLGVEEESTIDE